MPLFVRHLKKQNGHSKHNACQKGALCLLKDLAFSLCFLVMVANKYIKGIFKQ
jgi:hypothetical protein